MELIQYKNALLTETIEHTVLTPYEYTYDEINKLVKSNLHKYPGVKNKYDCTHDTQVFIDEHVYELFDLMDEFKDRYFMDGMMADMTYEDLIHVLKQCISVQYSVEDTSDDEFDDDFEDTTSKSDAQQKNLLL